MAEEKQDTGVDSLGFTLFLILILLFLGNTNTFGKYFGLFDKEVNNAMKIFQALSATADGLKTAFENPREVLQELEL